MSNSLKIALGIVLLIILIAVFIFAIKPNSQNSDESLKQPTVVSKNESTNSIPTDVIQSITLADQWQWSEGQSAQVLSAQDLRAMQASGKPYTLQSIYTALEAVRLDEFGNIILDHNALLALEEALARYHQQIDAQSLRELEQIIKDALPGEVGLQVAQLVRDYHGFLGAQADFNQIHQYNTDPKNLSDLDRDRNLYAELQSLRETHLGTDTAQRLFEQTDAGAQFMFDMMSLEMDQTMSEQEKQLRRSEIQERFNQAQNSG